MSSVPQKPHSYRAVADQAETSAAQQQRLHVLDEYRLPGICVEQGLLLSSDRACCPPSFGQVRSGQVRSGQVISRCTQRM